MDLTVNVVQFNGTGNPPIDLVVDAAGIDIGGDSNGGASATHTATVTDNSSVVITVSQATFVSYSMTISNVYDSDKTIFIILVDVITDVGDPDFNRPHPMHFFFQDPCSFKVDMYSATSFGGNESFFVDNVFLTNGRTATVDFCGVGDHQIKIRNTTFSATTQIWDRQWATTDEVLHLLPGQVIGNGETGNTTAGVLLDLATYLALDVNVNITEVEFRPEFQLTVSSPEDLLEQECCFARFETVTVTPDITIIRPGAVVHTIAYTVTDPDSLDVPLAQSIFPVEGFLPSQIAISFPVDRLGTYTITAILDDVFCDNQFTTTVIAETCNFIRFELADVDCNAFTLTNKSTFVNVTFSVTDLDNVIILAETTLLAGDAFNITLDPLGVFLITVIIPDTPEDRIEIYPVINSCKIEDCISKFILDVFCEDVKDCTCEFDASNEVKLVRLFVFYHNFQFHVHKEFANNQFYSFLSDTKIADLTVIQDSMKRIDKICTRETCIKDPCPTPSGDTGCGCGTCAECTSNNT